MAKLQEKHTVEISWATLWRMLLFVAVVGILYEGRQIFLGLFLAIIISSGLEGIVDVLEERIKLPRSVSVILIFLAALIAFILIVYTVVPFIIVELNTVFSGVNKTSLGGLGVLLNLQASQSVSSLVAKLSTQFITSNGSPIDLFSSVLGSFGLAAAVLVSSFYLSLGHDGVEKFLKIVVPPDYEEATMRIYKKSKQLIGSWFRMQLLLSVIMGFTVWAGLALLGVKYSFLIAIFAAIFELVPFLGPIISGAIAIVAALLTSTTLAFYTLIFFLVAQQFESNVLVPILSRRSVGLHPVIVIISLLIGATIGGLLGIIIAVPVAAIFQEVVQDWSSKQREGNSSSLASLVQD
jgi:predicted PurR-regulated permease PerM